MSVSFEARIDDRDVRSGFARLAGVMSNTTPVMRVIGNALVDSTHRRFVSQTMPGLAKLVMAAQGAQVTEGAVLARFVESE